MENRDREGQEALKEFEGLFEVVAVRDEAQIVREFGRGLTFLKFSPILERAFQNYYLSKYAWQSRIAIIMGILLYASFGLLDAIVFPDLKSYFWFIRFGVVIPLGFLFLFFTFKVHDEAKIELLHSFVVIAGGLGIVAMIYLASTGKSYLYYPGLMLVIFYAFTLSALRFYYASAVALTITFTYPFVDLFILNTPKDQLLTNMFFLGSATILGMPVSYLLERHSRRDFLLTMLLAFEKRRTEELNVKLKDMSYIDGLTGVANRLRFEEFFRKEWARAKRAKRPISLLMLDIDFFKNYNDLLGHLEGDECLQMVAGAIGKHIRSDIDLVARYGGEEFVVVLPETNLRDALKVAERIRKDIENLAIAHPGSKVSKFVTVSIGVACLVPTNNLKKEALIRMADKALYRAKEKGRNRVEYYSSEDFNSKFTTSG
ncbi:diguanylate cyclase (GGDEF)-like protein [Hydrogenivirga caldilitoris]|uniref:diguanylate cyclase n=1 Tax=Hydrogenivirga caldilitoris TaxID=246264 RepID=A0A497XND2_9AQUI|nr:diguanylate cyclase [Hydrogenivirga caldilitoris]RLJ69761.1 diguanylate cyclase (GGDEF)-like protein [Hydrogenivirga caldilitoris]